VNGPENGVSGSSRANAATASGAPVPASRLELAAFYRDHLERVALPFWLGAPCDRVNGGVFTCIENESGRRVSGDKFVWSQGRFAWLMAHAARMAGRGVLAGEPERYLRPARETADFLMRHAFLADGTCAYLLAEDGTMKEFLPGNGHHLSFFADCFVVLGLAEVARAAGEEHYLERALDTYDNVRERLARDAVRSEPYPVPEGFRAHARPMIMLNVAQELERALVERGHRRSEELARHALAYMDEILTDFVRPDGLVQEVLGRGSPDSLLTRHVTPGHAIESMWFVIEQALRHGRSDVIPAAARVIKSSFAAGWDHDHGGLFRFVEPGGRPPAGEPEGPFERLIVETWDTKIWWPHSETLYGALLAAEVTGDPELREIHDSTFGYTFATFPHPNPGIGEWIQIRDRRGRPLDKLVGLPVKDPYHLLRDLMVLVELLEEGVEARTTNS
jgi:N-acylglucosamine 2-epimerase